MVVQDVVFAVSLVALAAVNGALVWAIGSDRLPRNHYVGIRTRAAMHDDHSWAVAHRAALPALRWATGLSLVFAVAILVVGQRGFTTLSWIAPMIAMVAAGVVGDRSARALRM